MGHRHGWNRPRGNVAHFARNQRQSRNALRQRRAGPLFSRPRSRGRRDFYLRAGKLEINRNKFTSNPKEIAKELLKKVDEVNEEKKWSDQTALWQARWHLQNWIDCIRTREKPVADVEIGHRSISICHLANITRWIGERLKWDPVKEEFIDNDAANKFINRPRRKGFELPETV